MEEVQIESTVYEVLYVMYCLQQPRLVHNSVNINVEGVNDLCIQDKSCGAATGESDVRHDGYQKYCGQWDQFRQYIKQNAEIAQIFIATFVKVGVVVC